ncbi:hypothetical protein PPACK8108_LOCUS22316 [Phakopsora pachyrhizi]|uniref:Secreted protein n=1 Tax=Phakopsora pachyrhizi TaxID=170000 RepID=A0AAV0BMD0_PHAPC|nr:hypothetical protein PPACK8108_LOCUS22316 [Phakopsora pachyrhizi]
MRLDLMKCLMTSLAVVRCSHPGLWMCKRALTTCLTVGEEYEVLPNFSWKKNLLYKVKSSFHLQMPLYKRHKHHHFCLYFFYLG